MHGDSPITTAVVNSWVEGAPGEPASWCGVGRARFDRFDVDRDGVLNFGEIDKMMVELGFAQLESDYLTKLVARFDSDKVRHDRLLIDPNGHSVPRHGGVPPGCSNLISCCRGDWPPGVLQDGAISFAEFPALWSWAQASLDAALAASRAQPG